jgi:outer membrane murein-binding lipoprotein Lpp
MRLLCLVPVAALAACGGGQSENKAKSGAQTLAAGQYEITSEVTQFRQADAGAPKINTPAGTRTTRSLCLSEGGQAPPDLFADEGLTCQSAGSFYARNGVLNLQIRCTRPDLQGNVSYTVNGSFDGQSFQADRQLSTSLSGDGDVVIASRIQGRRTGECTPGAAPVVNGQADKAGGKGK